MPSILVVSGPSEGLYQPLGKRTIVIGRDEGCPLQVVDDRVSRKHVQIRYDDGTGKYIALDMKSANGMFINGRKIDAEIDLRDNDEIQIGNSKLVFCSQEFPDKAAAMNAYKQRGQKMRPTIEQR
ncbi:MAG: FHA domain-containing protein [Leptolyngbya sp. PLA1]|nr:FHA domain-containing protein [Leptolyngbya sp. PLA1]